MIFACRIAGIVGVSRSYCNPLSFRASMFFTTAHESLAVSVVATTARAALFEDYFIRGVDE
jgi:hypothetical protein